MASKFVLTAELALQAPKNAPQIIQQLNRQLASGVKVAVAVEGAKRTERELSSLNRSTKNVSRSVDGLSRSFAVATRRFAAFSVATRAVSLLTNRLSSAVDEAIKFQREMNKVAQVTGKTASELKFLERSITSLSTSLGTSSGELTNVARILSQAGFEASDLKSALSTLAKTTLAPTFDDITRSAEGAVAIFNQFGKGSAALEGQFGAINAVAGKFAVESGDLIGAVRRVGGVFKSAGGNLNDLLALFTSIRSTTRESAESIATGLRTIFTRIQRPKTIEFLRKFGVELEDLGGKFVGPFEATRRLSAAFGDLPEGDVKLIRVGEELAGFRQIGKVIPLLQQFAIAEKARQVALAGAGSLDADAAKAQQTLAVQITKVKEEYLALIRSFAETTTFKTLVKITLGLATSFAKILENLKPLLPLITTFAAVKLGSGLAGLVGSRISRRAAGGPIGLARGGVVPGSGSGDTVPALLTPGEFVIKKSSVGKIGSGALSAMNNNRFAKGGPISRENAVAIAVSDTIGEPKRGDFSVSILGSGAKGKEGTAVLRKKTGANGILNSKTLEELYGPPPGGKLTSESLKKGRVPLKDLKEITGKVLGFKDTKKYQSLVEGFDSSDAKSFSQIADSKYKGFITNVAQQFGKEVKVSDFGEVKFESGITQSEKGQLFENVINAFDGRPLKGLAGNERAAFDFKNGIRNTGKLFDEIKKENIKYVDAKVSPGKGGKNVSSAELTKKTLSQLAEQVIDDPGFDLLRKKRASTLLQSRTSDNPKAKKPRGFASGGGVSDTVPALLTPGEFVINKGAASRIGTSNLHKMNKGGVPGFASGGFVGGVQRFQNGGGVLGGGNLDFFTRLAIVGPVVTGVIASLGDTSEKASDELAAISIVGQKVAATFTVIGGSIIILNKARKAIRDFQQSITKSAERFGDTIKKSEDNIGLRKRETEAVVKSAKQSQGIKDSLEPRVERDRQSKAELEKANIRFQRKEFFGQQKVDILKAFRAVTGDFTLTPKVQEAEANLLKVRKRQEAISKRLSVVTDRLSKNQLRLTGASNSLKKAQIAGIKAAERQIVAEKRLANLRRKNSRAAIRRGIGRVGGAAASVATGALAVGAIVQQIGTAISGSISEIAGRERARLEKKGDVSGVARTTQTQGFADLVTRQLSLGGIIQSFIDPNTIQKGLQGIADQRTEDATNVASSNIGRRFTEFGEGDKGEKDLDVLAATIGADVTAARAAFESTGLSGDASREQRRDSLSKLQKSLGPTAELFGRTSKSTAELEERIKKLTGKAKELVDPLLKLALAAGAAAAAQEARGKLELDSLKITSAVKRSETARDNRIAGFETGSSPLEANLKTLQTSLSTLGGSVAGERAIGGLKTQLQGRGIDVSGGSLVGRQIDNASSANAFQKQFDDLVSKGNFLEGDQKEDFLRELTILAEGSKNDIVSTSVLDAIGSLRESSEGGRLKANELSGIGQTILDASQSVIKPLALLSQAEIDHLKVINELTRKRRTVELEYIATQQKSINTQIEASKIISQFGGARFSSQNELGARASQFNLRAQDAGVGGLGSGTASDIGRVGSSIARRFQELQISATRGGLAGTGGLGVDEDRRKELQTANQSLILFTKQRIDLLKKEVDIVKQKNALEKSSIESLLSGDIEGFFKQQGSAGAASALRSGDTAALRAFSATDIAGGLQAIREQLDTTGGDRQGFERAAASVLGGFGLSGRSAQVFADTTPEIENFNRQIRDSAEQLGRQAGIAAELQSMNVSAAQVVIDATNVEFRNAQARGGVGQPVPFDNQMVSQLNNVTDKFSAVAGALQNTSVKFSVPEGIKVFLEGADFLNISEKLTPFVNDLIGAYVKNIRLSSDGPKQGFGLTNNNT